MSYDKSPRQTYVLTFYEHLESVFLSTARHNFCAYAGQKRLIFPAKPPAQKFMPDSFYRNAENTREGNALFGGGCFSLQNHFYMAAAKQPQD